MAEPRAASAPVSVTVTVPDEASTLTLAASLARQCREGDCILLNGDLGAGKTAFARGFVRALCNHVGEVVSPTFTLVQTYPADNGATVWHFDLYRLRHAAEALETGLEEALASGITLVEWPDVARSEFPPAALDVRIENGSTPGERVFTFSGLPAQWQERLQSLEGRTV